MKYPLLTSTVMKISAVDHHRLCNRKRKMRTAPETTGLGLAGVTQMGTGAGATGTYITGTGAGTLKTGTGAGTRAAAQSMYSKYVQLNSDDES